MIITVFTSNQPRHLSLIKDLATIADKVYAVMEVNTVFPGQRADFFKKTPVMQEYFSHVIDSEQRIFGHISPLPGNVHPLVMKLGDLPKLSMEVLKPVLESDQYIVFGASYIREPLIDFLVENKALNIHMGVSPYYRGSSCNFWAAYQGNLDLVGATIHLLSKGLDSGDMLFHALPTATERAFDLGMRAVKSAHLGLIEYLSDGSIHNFVPQKQDKGLELSYTRNADFTDEVAADYLGKLPDAAAIEAALANLDTSKFLHPFIH